MWTYGRLKQICGTVEVAGFESKVFRMFRITRFPAEGRADTFGACLWLLIEICGEKVGFR